MMIVTLYSIFAVIVASIAVFTFRPPDTYSGILMFIIAAWLWPVTALGLLAYHLLKKLD